MSAASQAGHEVHRHTAERLEVIAAFAAIYVIWGSTYLAIRFAIETMPPLLMAGVRFLVAGSLLYAWVRLRGTAAPARDEWRATAVVGGLMLLGGNGAVVWAEQRVPSGIAALMVALVPLWMVLLQWRRAGERPGAGTIAGVALGLGGMLLLVGPEQVLGGGRVDHAGALVLALGTLAWALGSLYSRRAHLPASPWLATAMEMLGGGALLVVAAAARGELAQVDLAAISTRSALALGYLVVFGSLIGFSSYIWLLRVAAPARVATYAYVNPVVAMVLGWALAGEPLAPRTLAAAAVIVGAVVLITRSRPRGSPST